VEIAELSEDGRSGRFVIEPLERGFGYTLGNPIRRTLLSALRGAAVWAFRIDGVVHEHQTIEGVVEDVHQVIQNLKALVVRWMRTWTRRPSPSMRDKAGPVTAEDQAPASVEVLEPGHHILTLEGGQGASAWSSW
jgi:DNA-directed RNA polymerase subunit alpha